MGLSFSAHDRLRLHVIEPWSKRIYFITVVDRFRNCFRDVIYLLSQKAPYINRTSCLDIGVRDVSMVDAWFSVCPSSDLIQTI